MYVCEVSCSRYSTMTYINAKPTHIYVPLRFIFYRYDDNQQNGQGIRYKYLFIGNNVTKI